MDLIIRKGGLGFVVGVLVIVFVFGFECCGASGNVVFQVHHAYGGSKRASLTRFKAHDSVRHRRILSAVDLPIGGDGSPTSSALAFYLCLCINLEFELFCYLLNGFVNILLKDE